MEPTLKSLVGKLRALFYAFRYLIDFLDIKLSKTLYYVPVESQMQNGIVYIIKIIYHKVPIYPSDDLFKEPKLLDRRHLYILSILKYMNKGNIHTNNLEHSHVQEIK